MPRIHRNLDIPDLKGPKDLVEFEGARYRPIVLRLDRGMSQTRWIFNYLSDDESIYFVHKTKSDHPTRLKPLKRAAARGFRAVYWNVGRDDRRIFHYEKACRHVRSPASFRLLDEELALFRDDECFYDRYVRAMDVDVETFELVPMTTTRRTAMWADYNKYLANRKLPPISIQNASRYGKHSIDRRGLYARNVTVNLYERCSAEEVRLLFEGEGEDREDLQRFLADYPRANDYPWVKKLRRAQLL